MNQFVLMAAMAAAACAGGLAQIFMKRASGVGLIKALPFFLMFAALYGFGVIINYGVYRFGGRVSVMYPIISISYIAAAFFAWKILGEPVNMYTWVGSAIIIIGVALIGFGASS